MHLSIKKMISLVLSVSICVSLVGCNAQETASAVEEALKSMEEIQQTIEQFEVPEAIAVDDSVVEKEEDTEDEDIVEKSVSYPTEIDLTELYEDEEAFNADCDKAISLANELADKYKGKLSKKEMIFDFYEEYYKGEIKPILDRLGIYSLLGYYKDFTDSYYANLFNKGNNVGTEVSNIMSFEAEEISNLSFEERQNIFNSPELLQYKYQKSEYLDEHKIFFDQETQNIINTLTSNDDDVKNVYSIITEAETESGVLTLEDGQEIIVDSDLIEEIRNGSDYSHDFIVEAYNIYAKSFYKNANSITALLESRMKNYYERATIENYDSVLEYELNKNHIDRAIYDNCIESLHNAKPQIHRLVSLRKQALGIPEDSGVCNLEVTNITTDYNTKYSFDQAVSTVEKALEVYGSDYIEGLDEIVKSGHVDVYPNDNKYSGGFQVASCDANIPSYVLVNFRGNENDVETLAHELGHAMCSGYATRNTELNYGNNTTGIFIQEIASTLNELIYLNYMLDNSNDDEERLYYLEKLLAFINSSSMNQIIYTEFEQYCYEQVESGYGLDVEDISDYWEQLYKDYYGPDYEFLEGQRYSWMRVPHFYYGYYVYTYATSMTYAIIINNKIQSGDENIINDYLNMLSLGDSMKPADMLSLIGIDPSDMATYDDFNSMYTSLIDEYEDLLLSTGRIVNE